MPGESNGDGVKNSVFIKGGTIVNDDYMHEADVIIENGIIIQVGKSLAIPDGAIVVNAAGKLVMPGGIDTETHLEMISKGTKSPEDFFSGTQAAIAGGTTMIIDCVTPTGPEEGLLNAFKRYRSMADPNVCCDYSLHVTVTHLSDTVIKEMSELVASHGVTSFLISLADSCNELEDDIVYDIMKVCARLGALPVVHAENGKVIKRLEQEMIQSGITGPEGYLLSRPEEVEEEAVVRSLLLAAQSQCPLLITRVHSESSTERIGEARRRGQVVFGQTTPAALAVSGAAYHHSNWRHAAGHVCSPPLRPQSTTGPALNASLASGDLECLASNHAVFGAEAKAIGKDDFRNIPVGVNGLEERMMVVWEKAVVAGMMDPSRFVAVSSSNAAKMFNLYPQKGRIGVGSDADIVIWNRDKSRTLSVSSQQSKLDFNIFEGFQCHGAPDVVLVHGSIVLEDGVVKSQKGVGNFVASSPNGHYVHGKMKMKAQNCQVKPIVREQYSGPVIDLSKEGKQDRDSGNPITSGKDFWKPPPEPEPLAPGERKPLRTSVKTHHPPGGSSSGGFW